MNNIPLDVRRWYYYPIEMPLNSEGQGPASQEECTEITYEVWDVVFNSYSSHKNLPDAINEALRRNNEMFN